MRTIPELKEGTHRAKASGTLPNGKPVVVNADGTVSVISGTDEGFSSTATASTGNPDGVQIGSAFCPVTNKVVVAWSDGSNSNYGTAAVGTVSGSSISFGTEVVFASFGVSNVDVCEAGNGKVLVFYRKDTGPCTAQVGTISGTSISFGSGSEFFFSGNVLSAAYDSNAGKVVISFRKATSPNYMTSRVCTISGTSVSFGSEATVASRGVMSEAGFGTTTFDSNLNKIVVSFIDSAWGLYSAVGTVSGTSISYGSTTTVLTGNYQRFPNSTFDTTSNKVILSWHDTSAANAGKVVVGTISGTTISYGTAVEFSSSAPYNNSSTVVYDPDADKVVVSYSTASNTIVQFGTVSGTSITLGGLIQNTFNGLALSSVYDSNSNKVVLSGEDGSRAKSLLYLPATTTLTSENYIGISTGGTYADGSSATVDIIGTLNEDQSGLTAGQQYYVQGDGTIGETPADPSVFAGTAISATSLVVKT